MKKNALQNLLKSTPESYRKLIVGFDVDDTIVPFTKRILEECEIKFKKKYKIEDVQWGFSNYSEEEIQFIKSLWINTKFIKSLPLLEGLFEIISEIKSRGHDIIFCTATCSKVMTARALYLLSIFEKIDIPQENIIIAARKDLVYMDVFFDDSHKNIKKSRSGIPAMITMPWNRMNNGYVRVESLKDFLNIVLLAERGVTKQTIHMAQFPNFSISNSKIIAVSGDPAAGKTFIVEKFLEIHADEIEKVITCTTREPRVGEVNGKHYYFKSKEEFLKMKENGEFLETDSYAGHFYGTPKSAIQDILNKDKHAIIILTGSGIRKMFEFYGDEISTAINIQRDPSFTINEILDRNTSREDTIKRILKLIQKDDALRSCPYVLENNGTLEEAIKKLEKIIL